MADKFSNLTKRALADRAGHRCSNPGCRRATTKADPANPEKALNLGIGAHIKAASPGGPRYDGTMTAAERKSATNGVWLCGKCAKEIDDTPDAYPVETLEYWKKTAESITARDAAATADEIALLIAEIENIRDRIHEFIEVWRNSEPKVDFNNFKAYTDSAVDHGTRRQLAYNKQISGLVNSVLLKCERVLGENHHVIQNGRNAEGRAYVNYFSMQDMTIALDDLRESLLLR